MILTWIRAIAILLLNLAQLISLLRSSTYTAKKAWR